MHPILPSGKCIRKCTALLTVATFFFTNTPIAGAAVYYWVGGSGSTASPGLWEKPGNWSTFPKGLGLGSGDGATPTAADIAVLHSSGAVIQIRSAVTVRGLIFSPVWTGSLLQGPGTIKI